MGRRVVVTPKRQSKAVECVTWVAVVPALKTEIFITDVNLRIVCA